MRREHLFFLRHIPIPERGIKRLFENESMIAARNQSRWRVNLKMRNETEYDLTDAACLGCLRQAAVFLSRFKKSKGSNLGKQAWFMYLRKFNLVFSGLLLIGIGGLAAERWKDTSLPAEERASTLLQAMTLDEKISFLGNGFRTGNSRLGIPVMNLADSPIGLNRGEKPAVVYPAIVELAATFNPELAFACGEALGKNCRSRDFHIFLGPGVNIQRIPICGRNFEYFSEDPALTSRMAVEYIKGVRSMGVLATVKHFACNNQDYNRYFSDSVVDERTLQEIYFPAFKAAVQEGGAECVMTGHNKVNGEWSAASHYLLTDVLRNQWGFNGVVMADWNGRHDGIAAVQAGLNFDSPEGRKVNAAVLKPALQTGAITEAQIDRLVEETLRTQIKAGFFDRPQLDASIPENNPECVKASLNVAREGIVLLKNERNLLPLNKTALKKVVVIGPNAEPLVISGGGSARVKAFSTTSLPDAIRKDPDCRFELTVNTNDLIDTFCAQSVFSHLNEHGERVPGLQAVYYQKERWQGAVAGRAVQTSINGNVSLDVPAGVDPKTCSVKWGGQIQPQETAEYALIASSYDKLQVLLDGKPVIDWRGANYMRSHRYDVKLEAGRSYDIEIRFSGRQRKPQIVQFGWGRADRIGAGSAIEKLAADADVVLACVGYGPEYEGEDVDRSWRLPGMQRELLDLLTAVNSNTVVIANAGNAFETAGWIGQASAFLHAFYSGQEGGRALKEILFGETNPSGKLPFTFGKELMDSPAMATYNDQSLEVLYSEGVFTGYRGFDRNGKEPLFAFGYGLSYTTFEFSNLNISPVQAGGDVLLRVTCDVKNTGSRSGAETAQLYIGEQKPSVPRPVRELKGFRKVTLNPGETKPVEFLLSRRDFSFYDVTVHDWKANPGVYEIAAGASSRDLALNAAYTLEK